MTRHHGPVLVDTNTIIECFRTSSWRALTGGYSVETVEECVIETQTGFQRRRREQQIDRDELLARLKGVYRITDRERAIVALQATDIALDLGEAALWGHALSRTDAWVLCGPDRASLRFGLRVGLGDRLIALERLLLEAGHRPRDALRANFSVEWHKAVLADLAGWERTGRT